MLHVLEGKKLTHAKTQQLCALILVTVINMFLKNTKREVNNF